MRGARFYPAAVFAIAAIVLPESAAAQTVTAPDASTSSVVLTPAQLFALADAARDRGDFPTAEQAYRALTANPDIEIRTEARFRLGMMLTYQLGRHADAGVEFRKILDEKPRAGRVRLELARINALTGNPGGAARELRAAQAGGLPPEVRSVVGFYAAALEAQKPAGYSLGIAIAPDSNINRATRSDTLGTVIGDFTLDEDAKARSGVGLELRGQGYLRTGLGAKVRLLSQVSARGSLYRQSQFNDLIASVSSGPEFTLGKDRLNFSGSASWRWYGGDPFSRTLALSTTWTHQAGPKGQIKLGGSLGRDNNLRNDLQDATQYTASIEYDRALDAQSGYGTSFFASRSDAIDPGYSTTSAGSGLYFYREAGPATVVLTLGYSHLEADQRLFLYPARRVDDRYSIGLGATLRIFDLGVFAPVVQVRFERNRSTIEVYDYGRVSAEFGVTAAF